ncbi:MAG: hypothetical protein KJ957_03990 [Candidatus Omnitrophica bacterium]|nr:hypothetical protein [Candidatus Omnitrophota bacterium]MBU1853185.1 hypothetical protein [Candidatus Omnitrophota bacterium]
MKDKSIKELRDFGFRLGLGLNILGFIMFYREKGHFIWFSGVGSLNLIFAVLYPWVLAPIKKLLDFVILVISRLVSDISLIIAFYLIFAPLGMLFRCLGRDVLDQKIDKSIKSYWLKRDKSSFSIESYRRMG